MKIVHIAWSIVPSRSANSTQVMKVCEAFALNGHDVTLLVPDRPAGVSDVNDVFDFYNVEHNFAIERLPWVKFKGRTYIYNWLAARRAQHLQPDLVFARSLVGAYFAAMRGLPLVFEAHKPIDDYRHAFIRRPLFDAMISRPNFKRLVVVCDALRRMFLENHSIADELIVVAPNGASPLTSSDVPLPDLSVAGMHAGYIGSLYEGRGVDMIGSMAEKCPEVHFHLIGGNPDQVKAWQQKLIEFDNITFHGFMPYAEAAVYRQAFDVLLAPYQREVSVGSHGQAEASRYMCPIKLFEYMATGKAIICSDLPVLHEILEDGQTTLFCPPDDVDAWAAAVDRLNRDPLLRETIGEQARTKLLSQHTWQIRAEQVLAGLEGIGENNQPDE
ncbi:MAG: glycosyltransferase family 4 protein [Anaerolineae bacterium]|nr:glycosyltransferase family 4 protein [Anaerolineae bacterium]